VHAQA